MDFWLDLCLFFTQELLKLIHIFTKNAWKLPKIWFVCKSGMFVYTPLKKGLFQKKKIIFMICRGLWYPHELMLAQSQQHLAGLIDWAK